MADTSLHGRIYGVSRSTAAQARGGEYNLVCFDRAHTYKDREKHNSTENLTQIVAYSAFSVQA